MKFKFLVSHMYVRKHFSKYVLYPSQLKVQPQCGYLLANLLIIKLVYILWGKRTSLRD